MQKKHLFFLSTTILFLIISSFNFVYADTHNATNSIKSKENYNTQDNVSSVEILGDKINVLKARVLEILKEEKLKVPGFEVTNDYQRIKAEIIEGDKMGEIIELENDYIKLKVGEKFYLKESVHADTGNIFYSVYDKNRLPALWTFLIIFLISVIVFGGIQGIRGLVSLIGSLLLIIFFLIPGVLGGYSPIPITLGVSSLIIILGSYVTHGFNKTTSSAVIGMIATVLFTGGLAYFAVHFAQLTGFESDEAVYLNFNTGGSIDFVGLLFGGIMIGLLGVLYDVAIGQAVSVEELHRVAPHLGRKIIFKRTLRIGREHIGALVNTLAIAYVGASLPLLLLFYGNQVGTLMDTINKEVFATEIIRTLIGSIGLVLAVPITTLIAVWILMDKKEGDHNISNKNYEKELEALDKHGHSHSH